MDKGREGGRVGGGLRVYVIYVFSAADSADDKTLCLFFHV